MTNTLTSAIENAQLRELTADETDHVSGGKNIASGALNLGFFWVGAAIFSSGEVSLVFGTELLGGHHTW